MYLELFVKNMYIYLNIHHHHRINGRTFIAEHKPRLEAACSHREPTAVPKSSVHLVG